MVFGVAYTLHLLGKEVHVYQGHRGPAQAFGYEEYLETVVDRPQFRECDEFFTSLYRDYQLVIWTDFDGWHSVPRRHSGKTKRWAAVWSQGTTCPHFRRSVTAYCGSC